jgi:hypothetical protein
VDAAKNDVAGLSLGGQLRKTIGIATIVGETYHLVALIVVTQDDTLAAESFFGDGNAVVHGAVRLYEVIFKRARCRFCNRCCSHLFVSAFSPGGVRTRPGTGMLKADSRLQ